MAKSELPNGWEWKKLGEACQINPRRSGLEGYANETKVTFVPMSAVDVEKGVIRTREIRHLGEVKKGYTFFRENDVLFAKITPCMQNGKSAIARNLVNGLGFGSTEFHVLRPRNDVLSEWVYFLVRQKWFRDLAASNFTGSVGQQRVPAEFLEEQEVPVPPLEKQRRIVARIDELLSRLEQAKSIRQNSRTQASSIMPSALHEIFSRAEQEGWETTTVSEISEKPQYGYTQSANPEPVGPKFLRITDIQEGKVDWNSVPFCQCPSKEIQKYRLHTGDIVFARSGATTGKTFLIRECPEAVFASYLIRLRIRNNTLHEYLYWFFQSPFYWEQVNPRGGAQPNMNAKVLAALKVPLPDIYKQRRIVAYLDHLQERVNELQHLQSETQKELDQTTQSILSKAFQGQLV